MYQTLVTVIGNVVDSPKRRLTSTGISVTNFRLAATERRRDRDSQQWEDGENLFTNVTCWRALADNVARSLVKGDPVIVRGRLYTRQFEHEGQRRMSIELEATAVGPNLVLGQVEFARVRSDVVTHGVMDDEGGPERTAPPDRDPDREEVAGGEADVGEVDAGDGDAGVGASAERGQQRPRRPNGADRALTPVPAP